MEEVLKKIAENTEKIDKIYKSVEKTRKYFFWTMVITIATVVVPLIVLAFVVPAFLKTYIGGFNGLL
ncbi:MAG: hypothetical protein EXS49_02090 [Candidatus Pacebacteria bacterium]|nr:hypothetical protein [Candidatus Paceibacterota bacterium]